MKTLLLIACLVITSSLSATETQQRTKSVQLQQQAAKYPYLFRQGDFTVAPQAVALLEEATRLDADDAAQRAAVMPLEKVADREVVVELGLAPRNKLAIVPDMSVSLIVGFGCHNFLQRRA